MSMSRVEPVKWQDGYGSGHFYASDMSHTLTSLPPVTGQVGRADNHSWRHISKQPEWSRHSDYQLSSRMPDCKEMSLPELTAQTQMTTSRRPPPMRAAASTERVKDLWSSELPANNRRSWKQSADCVYQTHPAVSTCSRNDGCLPPSTSSALWRSASMKTSLVDTFVTPVMVRKASLSTGNLRDKHATSEKGCSGLRNLGNTCFMNCVIQCLSNTRPLLEFCLDTEQCEAETSASVYSGRLIRTYVKLMQYMWAGESRLSPTEFYTEVSRFANRFTDNRQHDAQEFLVHLLQALQKDLSRVLSTRSRVFYEDSHEWDALPAFEKARESWNRYICHESSVIVALQEPSSLLCTDIFVGQLKSTLTCNKCGHTSDTFEPFIDLSLPVRKKWTLPSSGITLMDCFNLFTLEESLTGDDRPECSYCQKKQKATKRLYIQKFPNILIKISDLKRFAHDSLGTKLLTKVKCPLRSLDLQRFAAEKCRTLYNLYAVVNHVGDSFDGHYTASARHPYTGQWHCFNDHIVTPIHESNVISAESYILFYEYSAR